VPFPKPPWLKQASVVNVLGLAGMDNAKVLRRIAPVPLANTFLIGVGQDGQQAFQLGGVNLRGKRPCAAALAELDRGESSALRRHAWPDGDAVTAERRHAALDCKSQRTDRRFRRRASTPTSAVRLKYR
jgi:hypothetical protein